MTEVNFLSVRKSVIALPKVIQPLIDRNLKMVVCLIKNNTNDNRMTLILLIYTTLIVTYFLQIYDQ